LTLPQPWRLFIAVAVPEDVRKELATAQAGLRQALAASGRLSLRWVRPEQFHLTLKFLGNVDVALAEPLAARLGTVCRHFPPLQLRAEGLGVFPESGLPRVIWAGVSDASERLFPLHRAVEDALKEFMPQPAGADGRTATKEDKFTGHVTLGRVREIRRPEAAVLTGAVRAKAAKFFGEWTADAIDLMRSELSSDGARHTRVAGAPFSGLT
jgi:2'-5' RNA ligase